MANRKATYTLIVEPNAGTDATTVAADYASDKALADSRNITYTADDVNNKITIVYTDTNYIPT